MLMWSEYNARTQNKKIIAQSLNQAVLFFWMICSK